MPDREASSEVGPETERTQQRSLQIAGFILLASMLLHERLCASLASEIALDIDPVNFIHAMREYDPLRYAPQPPGYLLYVLILRAFHIVLGGDPLATIQLVARLFSTSTIALVFAIVRRRRPGEPMLAAGAAVLAALHPFLVFHGVDGQTHNAEAFAAALLVLVLFNWQERPNLWRAVVAGAVLALGSAFRPSMVVVAIGPVIWTMRRHHRQLFVAGAVSMLGAVAWLWPTIAWSGGWQSWRASQDALINKTFARSFSPLSQASSADMVLTNIENVLVWTILVLIPVMPFVFGLRGKRDPDEQDVWREARNMLLCAVVPASIFYLTYYCSEPGYLSGLVPFAIVFSLLAVSRRHTTKRTVVAVALACASQVGMLALPGGGKLVTKLPSIGEIIMLDVLGRESVKQLSDKVPPGASLLLVTDHAGFAVHHQLPLLRAGADVMWLHGRSRMFPEPTISYSTSLGWTAIPGPLMLVPGPVRTHVTERRYDWVVVDAFISGEGRAALRAQTSCPIANDGYVALSAARCFPSGTILLQGNGLRFVPGGSV